MFDPEPDIINPDPQLCGELLNHCRVETKIFVFVFSRKFVFAFREKCLRKVMKILMFLRKFLRKITWEAKMPKSEFQEANKVKKMKECSGPTGLGNVQNQMRKTM
jgi:hypothetical protein